MNHTVQHDTETLNFARTLVAYTREHGGGTFDPNTLTVVQRDHGYACGGAGETRQWPAFVDDETLARAVAKFIYGQPHLGSGIGKRTFGTWIDNNILYVDEVDIFDNRWTAISGGFFRNQLAIWDFANNNAISIRGEK